MFGLSKRERYEREVFAMVHALFGEYDGGEQEPFFAPLLRKAYATQWDRIIKEHADASVSAQLTALALAVIFHQDLITNHTSAEDLAAMRRCIVEGLYDEKTRPEIIARIEFTTMVANGWTQGIIEGKDFALALRDIHRAIFHNNDDHVDQTFDYFIEGANRLKENLKHAKSMN